MRALILSHVYADPQNRGKLRALAGQGVELMVALPGGSAGLDGAIRLTPIPVSGDPAMPTSMEWDAAALRRTFSDFRPDLVQIEEPPGSSVAAVAARSARRLHIPYAVFGAESLPVRRGLFEGRRYRTTLSHAAGVIGDNRLAERLLAESAPKARTAVLPQFGVTPAAPVSREERRSGIRLGFVGRLVPERGGTVLLRALAQLMGAWTLAVAGTGPEQEALEALAERLGLASRIRWLGGIPRRELAALWPELDCLVVPSHDTPSWVERSNPMLLEAMAWGVVPVVTRAGALPELVGEAGVVVEDQHALTAALQELLAEPERVRRLSERARRRVLEAFVDVAIARRTLEFWREVLASATGAPVRGPGQLAHSTEAR